jgi:hypothetical protein
VRSRWFYRPYSAQGIGFFVQRQQAAQCEVENLAPGNTPAPVMLFVHATDDAVCVASFNPSALMTYKYDVVIAFCSYNWLMPTWDGSKRNSNIFKHGLDFVGCESIFDAPVSITEDASESYGEQRLNAIGWLQGFVVCLTYTERDDDFHVISLRKAEKHEIRRFIKEISN